MSCEPPDSLTHSCNVYLSHRYLVSLTTSRQHYTTNFLYIPFILLLCSCHYIHVFSYVNKSTKWCCWPLARTSVSLHATIMYSLQQFIVLMRKLIDIKTTTLGPYYYEVIHGPTAVLPYDHSQCMSPFHLHLLPQECKGWACAMSSFRKHNKIIINVRSLGKARTLKCVSYYFMIRVFWVVTSCNLVDGSTTSTNLLPPLSNCSW